jgi:hypothetical protein
MQRRLELVGSGQSGGEGIMNCQLRITNYELGCNGDWREGFERVSSINSLALLHKTPYFSTI